MAFSLEKFRLDGKVAIVTGAGGRPNSIGEAYCLGLAAAGASVVAADLRKEGADSVAAKVKAAGGKAIGVGVDITKPDSVATMIKETESAFGGVDILVNNAALMVEMGDGARSASDIALDKWNMWLAVNLTGALLCAQAAIPIMQKRGGGRIINQVSGGAYPPTTVYGVTKLALVGLTTTLAREQGPNKITVNAIAPGNTKSSAGASLVPEGAARSAMESMTALGFSGETDDLVGALLLLSSEAGQWMTGQVLHVDGGWVIRP